MKIATMLVLAALPALTTAAAAQEDREITNPEVRAAVERALSRDPGVDFQSLDVDVAGGILTLRGRAGSLAEKERAAQLAGSIKGVRAVINRVRVPDYQRDDERLRRDVAAALALDPAADSYEVDASAEDGVVTLTGSVDSWQERSLAEKVAKGVRGVRAVENQIVVEFAPVRPAGEIAADVRGRLYWDALVDAGLIDVQVREGTVTLTGAVGSAAERSRAYTDAWVAGVRAVDIGGLDVRWWAREEMRRKARFDKSDAEIERAVRQAFVYDPRVFSFNPDVSVENGIVTLTGAVDNLAALRAAEQDARNTTGVWFVRNYLKVRPKGEQTDRGLADRVRQALSRDPFVEAAEVAVAADAGKVELTGAVDTVLERARAEAAAAGVPGVTQVSNRLRVDDVDAVAVVVGIEEDWELRGDIKDELFWSPFVDSDQVKVSVEDGVATLRGRVESLRERRAALENAYEAGALRVRNLITVDGWPPDMVF